jgi:hypothetical protein
LTKTIQRKKNLILHHLLLIEISRSFPGVDVKNKFSRSFLGPWKKCSKFQEFSRNSRRSANPANKTNSTLQGIAYPNPWLWFCSQVVLCNLDKTL